SRAARPPSASGRLVARATRPISAGPASTPVYPSVVTVAIATPGAVSGLRPAALNSTGTMLDAPIPTRTNPIIEVIAQGSAAASTNPAAATRLPYRTMRTGPRAVVARSP